MSRTQCWCVDGESKFAIKLKQVIYRIELPFETDVDKEGVEELKRVLGRVIMYEKTPCPFKRGFQIDVPELPEIPGRRMSRDHSKARKWEFDEFWRPEGADRTRPDSSSGSEDDTRRRRSAVAAIGTARVAATPKDVDNQSPTLQMRRQRFEISRSVTQPVRRTSAPTEDPFNLSRDSGSQKSPTIAARKHNESNKPSYPPSSFRLHSSYFNNPITIPTEAPPTPPPESKQSNTSADLQEDEFDASAANVSTEVSASVGRSSSPREGATTERSQSVTPPRPPDSPRPESHQRSSSISPVEPTFEPTLDTQEVQGEQTTSRTPRLEETDSPDTEVNPSFSSIPLPSTFDDGTFDTPPVAQRTGEQTESTANCIETETLSDISQLRDPISSSPVTIPPETNHVSDPSISALPKVALELTGTSLTDSVTADDPGASDDVNSRTPDETRIPQSEPEEHTALPSESPRPVRARKTDAKSAISDPTPSYLLDTSLPATTFSSHGGAGLLTKTITLLLGPPSELFAALSHVATAVQNGAVEFAKSAHRMGWFDETVAESDRLSSRKRQGRSRIGQRKGRARGGFTKLATVAMPGAWISEDESLSDEN